MPGGRILVVDDEVNIRDAVGRFLEHEGYVVDYSPNGVDALDKVAAATPDLILLDLMMPGMNGREFIAALYGELGLTHIPVLVMTGIQGLAPRQAHELGAADVIEKPFDIDDILNKVALSMYRSGKYPAVTDLVAMSAGDSERASSAALLAPKVMSVGTPEAVPVTAKARAETGSELVDPSGVVILVESDLALRRHLDTVLGRYGFRVVAMGQVNDELPRLARVLEPDAILIEYSLPGLDGLSALRRLRSDSELDPVALLLWCEPDAADDHLRTEVSQLAAALLLKPVADDSVIGFVTKPPEHARRG